MRSGGATTQISSRALQSRYQCGLPPLDFSVILTTFNMPDRAYLQPVDPELVPGARNAIEVCLRGKREGRITIITDSVAGDIAAALRRVVERGGRDSSVF